MRKFLALMSVLVASAALADDKVVLQKAVADGKLDPATSADLTKKAVLALKPNSAALTVHASSALAPSLKATEEAAVSLQTLAMMSPKAVQECIQASALAKIAVIQENDFLAQDALRAELEWKADKLKQDIEGQPPGGFGVPWNYSCGKAVQSKIASQIEMYKKECAEATKEHDEEEKEYPKVEAQAKQVAAVAHMLWEQAKGTWKTAVKLCPDYYSGAAPPDAPPQVQW
jgi:hypothetical protein